MQAVTSWKAPAWLILVVLWVYFFISQGLFGTASNDFTGLIGVIVGLLVLTRHRAHRIVFWALAIGGLVAFLIALVGESDRAAVFLRAAAMIGLLLTAVLLARELTRAKRISFELVTVATCVYFLIGLFFGTFYEIIYSFRPESFSASAGAGSMVYFSFVTLTTLGFGDITATSSLLRSVVVFETVTGQLYLAIVLASLVGLMIAERSAERGDS